LTAVLVKDKERHLTTLVLGGRSADTVTRAVVRELEQASAQCRAEYEDWMKAARGELEFLELGRCLQEAKASVAFPAGPGGHE
jgi:hypothetical protein